MGPGRPSRRALLALAAALPLLLLLARLPGAAARLDPKPGVLEMLGPEATFTEQLKQMPEDRWVLMEFYARWCPHCIHFQPDYEKVAAFFQERGEQEPVVAVARIDCAEFNTVCNQFKIQGFPSMRVGLAADFAARSLDKLTEVKPASRKADSVVAFLAQHLNAQFDTSKLEAAVAAVGAAGGAVVAAAGKAAGGAASDRKMGTGLVRGGADGALGQQAAGGKLSGVVPQQAVDLVDVEGATITSWQYLTASGTLLKGPEARQALKDWVDLLAESHPIERCRKGAEQAQEVLDELWPDDADEPQSGLQQLKICPGSRFKEWRSCRGTTPNSRGYTCGLWQLFHTLASRLPDTDNAGAVWLATVKGFVKSYFQCLECAKHFVRHASGEAAVQVERRRDAVLWIWRAHNIVNRRLGAEEKADPTKGDPSAPHQQFPAAALCPKCRKADGQGLGKDEAVPWEEEEVYRFLLGFYSGEARAGGGLAAASGGGLNGVTRAGWTDAGLLLGAVAACVYAVLRRSGQYALRKSESRCL